MGMGLAGESYLRISSLRECYRVVSRRKPYEISMLKAQEYDVSQTKAKFSPLPSLRAVTYNIYNKVMGMHHFNPCSTGLLMAFAMATTATDTCPDTSKGHAVTKKHQIKE